VSAFALNPDEGEHPVNPDEGEHPVLLGGHLDLHPGIILPEPLHLV